MTADNQAETYRTKLDAVCRAAGGGDVLWNLRFITGLAERGLGLVPTQFALPAEYHLRAPIPFPFGLPQWPECYIIEIKHMTAAFAQERRQQGLDA